MIRRLAGHTQGRRRVVVLICGKNLLIYFYFRIKADIGIRCDHALLERDFYEDARHTGRPLLVSHEAATQNASPLALGHA